MKKYDIFISYSRKDFDEVNALVEMLKSRIPTLNYWFDITGIESGDEFEDKIIAAIDDSSYVLFALSDNSIQSQWAKDEVMYAKNTDTKVIPLLLKGAQFKGWFLFKFGRIDCIDTTNSLQIEKLIKNLSDWTGKVIANESESSSSYTYGSGYSQSSKNTSNSNTKQETRHTWTSEEEYYEKDYEDDTEYDTCPNCDSDDVEDDGSGFYQYTCNDCGHEWGDIDNEECPQCGSYNCEDDGTGELQYYCKECGHVWGDYDEEEEDEEYISSNNQNSSKRSQMLDVIKTCSKNSTWLDESCDIDNVYIDKCKSTLQRHYYIDVSNKEISSCKTIGKLIDLIESKMY